MDNVRWKPCDEFNVLDLVATLEAESPASVSFRLGKLVNRDTPRLPEMDGDEPWDLLLESGSVFVVLGWLDAHYPCSGAHPLRLRVGMPDRYVSWESMRDLVPSVIAALALPSDMPYRVHLCGLSKQTSIEEPLSEFVSTTRWQPSD